MAKLLSLITHSLPLVHSHWIILKYIPDHVVVSETPPACLRLFSLCDFRPLHVCGLGLRHALPGGGTAHLPGDHGPHVWLLVVLLPTPAGE